MRNMLQLLGGVAVAGAVAAGSTAFTAGGLTYSWSGSVAKDGFLGGSVQPTITGATLVDMTLAQTPAASPGVNDITGVSLKFGASTPTGATVTVTNNGTLSNTNGATGMYCTDVAANKTSACVVGTDASTSVAGDFYSGASTVTIAVS
jgi:hypothetical protein